MGAELVVDLWVGVKVHFSFLWSDLSELDILWCDDCRAPSDSSVNGRSLWRAVVCCSLDWSLLILARSANCGMLRWYRSLVFFSLLVPKDGGVG